MKRLGALAGCLLIVASGCAGTEPGGPPSAAVPKAVLTPDNTSVVAEDLEAPWSVAFYQDSALVSERDSGKIIEIVEDGNDGGAATTRTVGTIPSVHKGESGLLGIAVQGSNLFAYHTTSEGNEITSYQLDGEPGALELGTEHGVIDGLPSGQNHNGGRLAFGEDGMLYASVGDAGKAESAQDLDSLGGKILRMTPDGSVPKDNPIEDSLVYTYGHRNVEGLAWGGDGTMFASELGEDQWDELNVIEPGGNYGWPELEGTSADSSYQKNISDAVNEDELLDPAQQWEPNSASPSGIAIANGTIYVANLRGENLREVPLSNLTKSIRSERGEYGRLRDVTVSPDGDLWVLTNNTDGRGEPKDGDDQLLRVAIDTPEGSDDSDDADDADGSDGSDGGEK